MHVFYCHIKGFGKPVGFNGFLCPWSEYVDKVLVILLCHPSYFTLFLHKLYTLFTYLDELFLFLSYSCFIKHFIIFYIQVHESLGFMPPEEFRSPYQQQKAKKLLEQESTREAQRRKSYLEAEKTLADIEVFPFPFS